MAATSPADTSAPASPAGLGSSNVSNPLNAFMSALAQGRKDGAHAAAARFRRVVSLSDDVDPDSTKATYSDGVLVISIKRRTAAQSRRINIQ